MIHFHGVRGTCRRHSFVLGCALAGLAVVAASADVATDLAGLFSKGRYDELIARADEALAKPGPADRRVLYLRGEAEYKIGWFGAAQEDLAPLGDFRPWERWPPASARAGRIVEIGRLSPARLQELKDGETPLFSVYYDTADAWTAVVMAVLPQAHQRLASFYGDSLTETAAFIFTDAAHYEAFFKTWSGAAPLGWQWATGAGGILLYCERKADGSLSCQTNSDYQRSCVAHELNHCYMSRMLGAVRPPPWLSEGMAMLAGAAIVPADYATNDREIAAMVKGEGLLETAVMLESAKFYAADRPRQAYAQAFSMMRYLVDRLGEDGCHKLLTDLRDTGKLDDALAKQVDGGVAAFCSEWRAAASAGRIGQ